MPNPSELERDGPVPIQCGHALAGHDWQQTGMFLMTKEFILRSRSEGHHEFVEGPQVERCSKCGLLRVPGDG